jgi:hypothetical protein
MPNVTITNSTPNPDPAPISKGQNNQDLTIVFQTPDNNTTYQLSNLNESLSGGPDSVRISKGSPSGSYTANPNATNGTHPYSITVVTEYPGGAGEGAGQIQVDP